MSDPIQDNTSLLVDETPSEVNQLKRAASADLDESREAKAAKLEIATRDPTAQHVPHVLEQTTSTESVASSEPSAATITTESATNKLDQATSLDTSDETASATTSTTANVETTTETPATTTTTTATTTTIGEAASTTEEPNQQEKAQENQPETTANNTNNNPIININGPPPPPPGLHLLSDPQQQQLIQTYVQQGHDLTNLTASSLAQAMVSPIAVPNLATNLLQQLQQGGNVITALPGPPQLPQTASSIHNNANGSPLSEEGSGAKRTGNRNMSNDERRQRRLLRNRVAAKECRKKKKQHIHEMEEKIVQLEDENKLLAKEVEELKAKLSLGSMQGPESYRLMKEVEELNAKLGLGHLSSNGPALSAAAAAVLNAAQQQQQQQQQSEDQANSTNTDTNNNTSSTANTSTTTPTPPTLAPKPSPHLSDPTVNDNVAATTLTNTKTDTTASATTATNISQSTDGQIAEPI